MKLGLFKGEDRPNKKVVWNFYERAQRYNDQINLDAAVQCNENFFISKQWENVKSNGNVTPVFNFIKRVVMFDVAHIAADNLKINATSMDLEEDDDLLKGVDVVNAEFDRLMEQNNITYITKEFARDAAVRKDSCMYTWFDADADVAPDVKGTMRTEVLDNTDVFFGNPMDDEKERQPYILIRSLLPTREVMIRARDNDAEGWESIQPDNEFADVVEQQKICDDMTTLLLCLYKNPETRTVWAYECTRDCEVREPWDLKIREYPIVWMSWDGVKNCYHGAALVDGILNNQLFVNRAWASSMISINRTAFPKFAIDGTRIASLDNRVGGVVKVQGDPTSAIKALETGHIDPQVAQYLQMAVEETEKCLGATSVALGDTRPDNTSAIIALQRAASTPLELTKQNLRKAIEDLFRIYLDFMSVYYGKRMVTVAMPEKALGAYDLAGMQAPKRTRQLFDFGTLKRHSYSIKLDVGETSFWSEVENINMLNNLFQMGAINVVQLLKRIPKGRIPDLESLIAEKEAEMGMQPPVPGGEEEEEPTLDQMEVPTTGGGYGALQRKINEGVMAS